MLYDQKVNAEQLLQRLEQEAPEEAAATHRYADLAGKAAAAGQYDAMHALHGISHDENAHNVTLGTIMEGLRTAIAEYDQQQSANSTEPY